MKSSSPKQEDNDLFIDFLRVKKTWETMRQMY